MPTKTADQQHRHRIVKALKTMATDGVIGLGHVRPLTYKHCRVAKIPFGNMALDLTYAHMLAVLAGVFNGQVSSPDGRARDRWYQEIKPPIANTRNQGHPMEAAGYITRVMHQGGHLTDIITITNKGLALIGNWPFEPDDIWLPGYEPGGQYNKTMRPPAAPLVVAPTTPAPRPGSFEYNMTGLARRIIELGNDRDEQHQQIVTFESTIDDLVRRLGDANEEINRLRALVPEASQVNSRALHVSVGEYITDDERKALDRLMREVPPGS